MPTDVATIEEMMRRLREFASDVRMIVADFEISNFWLKAALLSAANTIENLRDQIRDQMKDYDEYAAERRQLIRQLDVAMNGEQGAAARASLCDLIPMAEQMREELKTLRADRAAHIMNRAIEEPVRDAIIQECIKKIEGEAPFLSGNGARAAGMIIHRLQGLKHRPATI